MALPLAERLPAVPSSAAERLRLPRWHLSDVVSSMKDDIAFRSQQWIEDVQFRNQALGSKLLGEGLDALGQGIGRTIDRTMVNQQRGFDENMKQQQFELDKATAAEEINTSQIRRAQAVEALAWTKELHTTDMLGLQKRQMSAATEYEEARLAKMRDDLDRADDVDLRGLDSEQMASQWAGGVAFDMRGNRVVYRPATAEETEQGKKWITDRNSYRQQQSADRQEATAGRERASQLAASTRTSIADQRDQSGTIKNYVSALTDVIDKKEKALGEAGTPAAKAALQKEIDVLKNQMNNALERMSGQPTWADQMRAENEATMQSLNALFGGESK